MKYTHKHILAVLGLGLFLANASAQTILTEHFNYTASGTLTVSGSSTWTARNTGDAITVASGNLSISGLAPSSGNKITFGGAGMEAYTNFTDITSGVVYYSFILNITSLGTLNATGGYLANYYSGDPSSSSTLGAGLWARSSGSDFNLGVNQRTTAASTAWASNTLSVNTSYFVVVSYNFGAGAGDDTSSLWISPTAFGAGTAPTATITTSINNTDLANVSAFQFRQDSTTATPGTLEIDELRVATTWAAATVPEPSTYALFGLGIGFTLWRLRRKRLVA